MKISIPTVIENMLGCGASLAISISGGKDSQAMLSALAHAKEEHLWPGRIYAVHANLGIIEWKGSSQLCKRFAAEAYIAPTDYIVVRNNNHSGLIGRIEARMNTLDGTGKPFWPSPASRYCTSDMKRDPINSMLRRLSDTVIVSAIGIRREESAHRRHAPVIATNDRITTKRCKGLSPEDAYHEWGQGNSKGRLGITWNPIVEWTEKDVWIQNGTSLYELNQRRKMYKYGNPVEALDGWKSSPAYVFGSSRHSCSICMMANEHDIQVGAAHNRDVLEILIRLERKTGCSFKNGKRLIDIVQP